MSSTLATVVAWLRSERKAVTAFVASAGPILAADYLGGVHVAHVWYVVALAGLAALGVHLVPNDLPAGASPSPAPQAATAEVAPATAGGADAAPPAATDPPAAAPPPPPVVAG